MVWRDSMPTAYPWSIADAVNGNMMELMCAAHGMPMPNQNSRGPNTIACSIQDRLCRLCSASVARHIPVIVRMAHAELATMAHRAIRESSRSVICGLHPLQIGLLPFSCATSVLECLCGKPYVEGPHRAFALAWSSYDPSQIAVVPSELVLESNDLMISDMLLLFEKTLRNYAAIGSRLCTWTNEPGAFATLDVGAVRLREPTLQPAQRSSPSPAQLQSLGEMARDMRAQLHSLCGAGEVGMAAAIREWLTTAAQAIDIVARTTLVDGSGSPVYALNVANIVGRPHSAKFFRAPHTRPWIEQSYADSAGRQRAAVAASDNNLEREELPARRELAIEVPGEFIGDSSCDERSLEDANPGNSSSGEDSQDSLFGGA